MSKLTVSGPKQDLVLASLEPGDVFFLIGGNTPFLLVDAGGGYEDVLGKYKRDEARIVVNLATYSVDNNINPFVEVRLCNKPTLELKSFV